MTDTKQIEPLSIDDIVTLRRRLQDHRDELAECGTVLKLYDGTYIIGGKQMRFTKKTPVRVVFHTAYESGGGYGSLGIGANPQCVLGLVHQRIAELRTIITDIEADLDRRGIKHGN